MALMQNTLKYNRMPFSNHLLINTCQGSRKQISWIFHSSSTFTFEKNQFFYFHPAGDVTRVFVVPGKVPMKIVVAELMFYGPSTLVKVISSAVS